MIIVSITEIIIAYPKHYISWSVKDNVVCGNGLADTWHYHFKLNNNNKNNVNNDHNNEEKNNNDETKI